MQVKRNSDVLLCALEVHIIEHNNVEAIEHSEVVKELFTNLCNKSTKSVLTYFWTSKC